MPRKRFLPSFRSRRPRRKLLWTASATADVLAVTAGSTVEHNLVIETDYQESANLENQGATLMRIRGSIWLESQAAVLGHCFGWVTIYKRTSDKGTQVFDASGGGLSNLIKEDILWHTCFRVAGTQTRLEARQVLHLPFDVKAKRKLLEDRIVLNVHAGSANIADLTFMASTRSLIAM